MGTEESRTNTGPNSNHRLTQLELPRRSALFTVITGGSGLIIGGLLVALFLPREEVVTPPSQVHFALSFDVHVPSATGAPSPTRRVMAVPPASVQPPNPGPVFQRKQLRNPAQGIVSSSVPSSTHGTTLHQAVQARGGRAHILQKIIDSGVDVNAIDDNGDTALHLELRKHGVHPPAVYTLLEAGTDVNLQNNSGETVVHVVVKAGRSEMLNHVLSSGLGKANLALGDTNGNTALHIAARKEITAKRMIPVLLRAGAPLDAKNKEGKTPAEWARSPAMAARLTQ